MDGTRILTEASVAGSSAASRRSPRATASEQLRPGRRADPGRRRRSQPQRRNRRLHLRARMSVPRARATCSWPMGAKVSTSRPGFAARRDYLTRNVPQRRPDVRRRPEGPRALRGRVPLDHAAERLLRPFVGLWASRVSAADSIWWSAGTRGSRGGAQLPPLRSRRADARPWRTADVSAGSRPSTPPRAALARDRGRHGGLPARGRTARLARHGSRLDRGRRAYRLAQRRRGRPLPAARRPGRRCGLHAPARRRGLVGNDGSAPAGVAGPYSVSIFLGSLFFPVLAGLGLRASLRARGQAFVRLHAG